MPTLTAEQLQQQLEELKRSFEEAMNEEANFRQNFETLYASVVNRAGSRDEISASRTPSIPGVPAWLSPILQGVTIMVLLGAIFWVGQTTGTIAPRSIISKSQQIKLTIGKIRRPFPSVLLIPKLTALTPK